MLSTITPWVGWEQLRRDMDRLFDDYRVGGQRYPRRRQAYPALNVWDITVDKHAQVKPKRITVKSG